MKKGLLFLCAIRLLSALTACNARKDVESEEEFITKDYTFEDLNEITIKDIHLKQGGNYFGANVYFMEADTNKISIAASKDVLEEIKVKEFNSEITISASKYKNYVTKSVDIYIYGYHFEEFNLSNVDAIINKSAFMGKNVDLNLSGACKAEIDEISKDLDLDTSGASAVYIKKMEADELEINSSGASNIEINALEVNEVNANLSGASRLYLNGKANKAKYIGSGASYFNLKNCPTDNVDVNLSGASEMLTSFNLSLIGDISGGSELTYYSQSNNVNVKDSGGSEIKRG